MFKLIFGIYLCFTVSINALYAQNFNTHQVKAGETLESLSKQYFVTPAQILELNPDVKGEIKANTILIIPVSKAKPTQLAESKELIGFKEHKVKRKETLYSLAKANNVTEDEIKKQNPSLYANPLKKRDVIKIPIYRVLHINPLGTNTNSNTKTYIVKAKEGKWRIAYKYGITLNQFNELNPNVGETLKEGQEVLVPNTNERNVVIDENQFDYYTVLPKEGFYRLKVKLGLDQETLERINPELKETGLKEGMILKIPKDNNNAYINTNSNANTPNNEPLRINTRGTKHIAVILPFGLNKVNTESDANTIESIKNDMYLNSSLDFYSGMLVAFDNLKSLGISLKVDVYDSKNSTSETVSIIKNNGFNRLDAVIGPLGTSVFNAAAAEMQNYNTPIFSPIGTDIRLYKNTFQTKAPAEVLKRKIIQYVQNDVTKSNVMIIANSGASQINDIKNAFGGASVLYSRKNKNGSDANYVMPEDIRKYLLPGKNYVFLESQNEGLIASAVSALVGLNGRKVDANSSGVSEIILVTTNYNNAFEGDEVSNEFLSKLQFHYAATSKSITEKDTNSFITTYRNKYNALPNKAATRGYDLTMDIVLRLAASNDIYSGLNQFPEKEYVENRFHYIQNPSGGFVNQAAYIVKYNNLSIVAVE